MGVIRAPRFTDLSDDRQKYVLQQLLTDLRSLAFRLTFLDTDGGIGDQRKPTNFDAMWVTYVSNATPDTEDTVPHGLGRVPQIVLPGTPDKEAVIYDGDTEHTSDNLFLKSTAVTSTVNLLIA